MVSYRKREREGERERKSCIKIAHKWVVYYRCSLYECSVYIIIPENSIKVDTIPSSLPYQSSSTSHQHRPIFFFNSPSQSSNSCGCVMKVVNIDDPNQRYRLYCIGPISQNISCIDAMMLSLWATSCHPNENLFAVHILHIRIHLDVVNLYAHALHGIDHAYFTLIIYDMLRVEYSCYTCHQLITHVIRLNWWCTLQMLSNISLPDTVAW